MLDNIRLAHSLLAKRMPIDSFQVLCCAVLCSFCSSSSFELETNFNDCICVNAHIHAYAVNVYGSERRNIDRPLPRQTGAACLLRAHFRPQLEGAVAAALAAAVAIVVGGYRTELSSVCTSHHTTSHHITSHHITPHITYADNTCHNT